MADMDPDPAELQRKAEAKIREADRIGTGIVGWFNSFGPDERDDLCEAATNYYTEAANILTAKTRCIEAAKMHEKAAGVFIMMKAKKIGMGSYDNDTASCFFEAAKLYAAGNDYPTAIRCLEDAIFRFQRNTNFLRAAKLRDMQADMYLNQLGDITKAIECYKQSVDWLWNGGHPSQSIGVKRKLADLLASDSVRQYAEAKQLYEDLAKFQADSNKKSAHKSQPACQNFFNAFICAMISDPIILRRTLDEYIQIPGSYFGGSQERENAELLLVPLLEGDKVKFWELIDPPPTPPPPPSTTQTQNNIPAPAPAPPQVNKLTPLQRSILWAVKCNTSTEDFS